LDDQLALDNGPLPGHSLFTGCLIEALTGGLASSKHESITGSELGLYVQNRVRTYPNSSQTPDFGTFDFDDRGELVISLADDRLDPAVVAAPLRTANSSGWLDLLDLEEPRVPQHSLRPMQSVVTSVECKPPNQPAEHSTSTDLIVSDRSEDHGYCGSGEQIVRLEESDHQPNAFGPKIDVPGTVSDAKIELLLPVRSRSISYRGKIDFGVLTIREDENAAVLRRFDKLDIADHRRRYRIRHLPLPTGEAYTLAVLRTLEHGTTDAQAATHALLEDLAPRFVLVVGIAGGIPSYEFSLGDVVVSSRIADFSVEAVIRDKGTEYALAGGPLHPDAAKLAADISASITDGELEGWNSETALKQKRPLIDLSIDRFYGNDDWKKFAYSRLNKHFSNKSLRGPFAMTGAIASSDRLIKDDEKLAVWLKIARQVVAVEMESAGIYKATQERGVPFLAVRGISDIVGFERDPDWTTYACQAAATFARSFLCTRPIEPIASGSHR
jgi:nucleoside phosphorylase